jgi:hypothetical protein
LTEAALEKKLSKKQDHLLKEPAASEPAAPRPVGPKGKKQKKEEQDVSPEEFGQFRVQENVARFHAERHRNTLCDITAGLMRSKHIRGYQIAIRREPRKRNPTSANCRHQVMVRWKHPDWGENASRSFPFEVDANLCDEGCDILGLGGDNAAS